MFSKEFTVAIVVSDSKKAAAWYGEKLGLESSTSGHWVTVWPKGSNAKIHLCEGDPEPGNTGWALYTKDLKKEIEGLKEKGANFSKDYTKESWGTYAMVSDPDGNEIWLMEE